MKRSLTLIGALALAAPAMADIQISEWMYSGNLGEYIEFTNMGASAVDFNGWSYADSNRTPGGFDLSGFGLVGVGESVVITEVSAAAFITDWSLGAGTKVLGGYTNNIGRTDEINLFDAGGNLVDRLTYGDTTFVGSPRTQRVSGNPVSLAALGPDTASADWVLAAVGDAYGSYLSASGDLGNPGSFVFAPVPEPATTALLLAGLGLVGAAAARRRGVKEI